MQLRGRLQPISGGGAVEALRRQGVMAAMSYPRVSYLANPQANAVLTVLARLREQLGAVIDQAVPEPAASELKATVLGIRGALPKDEQQALIDTGTVHLIVISGFKMTLIAAALQLAGAWILRRTTARLGARAVVTAIVVAAIAAYTLLSGATPSAVRAAIMAGTVALAPLMGRPRDQVSALALAVLAIVAPRPLELLDGGFQLSCLSVLGIALLAEPLGSRLRRVMQRGPAPIQLAGAALAEAVAASVAATVFILPVLAASFHVVSLISPLANLLGMPLLGPIMAFGGLGAALGAVWQPLGTLLLWPGWAFMTLLDWLIRWTAGLPNAALPVDALPPALVVSYYGLLSAATAWLRRRREDESPKPVRPSRAVRWAVLGGGAIAVASLSTWNSRAPATLRATLLAVPGQAALIQTPAGRTVLVDGGQNGGELLRRLGYLLPPWDRHLDLVLITSPRSDHIGGLDEVFARYGVGSLIEPDVERPSASFRRLQAGTRRAIADVVELGDGARLARDGETWRLEQGETSVVVSERGFAIRTPSGEFQVLPVRKGRGTASEADNVLDLSETGDVTVTFGSARPLD